MAKKKRSKRVGILTGGGDCPGLNAAIRAVVKTLSHTDYECLGIQEGFLGLFEGHIKELRPNDVSGILNRGGTILRSSRFNPFKKKKILRRCVQQFHRADLSGLIAIGGNGSLGIASDLHESGEIPVIGIPKTIDNDVVGTDVTIGFQTAVSTAMDAIDKLHTTAESHNFIMVVEVMGRHCGWLACEAGLASGADMILVPEKSMKLADLIRCVHERQKKGKNFSIIVVAEDARLIDDKGNVLVHTASVRDEYGKIKLSGAGERVAEILRQNTKLETRCTVLGHVQRGGAPVAADRLLATRMGCLAADMVLAEKWGVLTAQVNGKIKAVPLEVVHSQKNKKLSLDEYEIALRFSY